MKMKLYYVVEKLSDDTCEMIAGPYPTKKHFQKPKNTAHQSTSLLYTAGLKLSNPLHKIQGI